MTAADADSPRVDIARWFRRELFLGASLPTALGACGVVAAAFGLVTDGSVATRVVVGVLGAAFLAIGGGLYFWLFVHPPQSWLRVDGTGMARSGHRRTDWTVSWSDIASVSVVRTRMSTQNLSSVRGSSFRVLFPRHYLRLQLTPAAAARPAWRDALSGPKRSRRVLDVDLGVPPRTAREVLALLGPRAQPAEIVRLRTAEPDGTVQ